MPSSFCSSQPHYPSSLLSPLSSSSPPHSPPFHLFSVHTLLYLVYTILNQNITTGSPASSNGTSARLHTFNHGSPPSTTTTILTIRSHILTIPLQAPLNHLAPRAEGCPATISSGGIAGIVIGSIAGTLLVLWLWRLFKLPGAFSGGGEPDVGYRPPITRSSGRRRRSREPRIDYVEKPRRSSSRRYRDDYYRDDVRRPAKVYMTE